jgi:hypothetical protein
MTGATAPYSLWFDNLIVLPVSAVVHPASLIQHARMKAADWPGANSMENMDQNFGLVRCGNGKRAPGWLVCKHLLEHPTATKWIPIDEEEEGQVKLGYFCPRCKELDDRGMVEAVKESLEVICLGCLRKRLAAKGLALDTSNRYHPISRLGGRALDTDTL